MSRLVALQAAIVADLGVAIPEAKDIKPYGGRFEEKDLKARTIRPPALRVSVLGAPVISKNANDNIVLAAQVAVVVLDKTPEAAMALAERVVIEVHGIRWSGLDNIGMPETIALGAIFADKLGDKHLSLWAVTWRQSIWTGTGLYEATLEGLPATLQQMFVDGAEITPAPAP
ncbi:MAG: hypothetical protein ACTSX7_05985 [Alphaproteobacteria bacterium]